ncbi:MAG: glycosyl transferase [Prevotella sp.]|nr:glycosyl transferase [Prevotella sp.]
MIPKIIHLCWFGGNPLPPLALECIASWRKYFPDYEIWQWREDDNVNDNENVNNKINGNEGINVNENENVNDGYLFDKKMAFDVNSIPYTAEAYAQKKYAFVSDYARIWALYNFGGIYFDTDVEVIKPMDDIISQGAFMGFEVDPDGENSPEKYAPRYSYDVALGLGFGIEAKHPFMLQLMDYYKSLEFDISNLTPYSKTIVAHTTENLVKLGLKNIPGIQEVGGITIYPSEYFAPINAITGRLHITENTRSIHRYMASWNEQKNKGIKDYIHHYIPESLLILYNKIKRRRYRIINENVNGREFNV